MEILKRDAFRAGRTLVIMAKAPRAGMVKTRLAKSLPVHATTELYRCLLSDTINLARSLEGVEVAIMCPEGDIAELTDFAEGVHVVGQRGTGLAAGLDSVFAHFATAGRRRVIAFNSDSPHLSASVLENAFEALISHDLVVGPTDDGGYYLVGATRSHPGLFDGDRMGTSTALEALLARARGMHLSMLLTDVFYDIDLPADLFRLAVDLHSRAERAPRTAAWIVNWKRALSEKQSRFGGVV
jgi:rSAM/selenodomain-associated transferase 1